MMVYDTVRSYARYGVHALLLQKCIIMFSWVAIVTIKGDEKALLYYHV